MKIVSCFAMGAAAVALGTFLAMSVSAQTDDLFDFIPSGGRTLLTDAVSMDAQGDQVAALLSGQYANRDEWLSDLESRKASIPGLADLDDQQLLTLADYLSLHMPLPADKIPGDPASADWGEILPRDGRDLTLTYCQSCHIITVVITQDRTREAWLGTMNKPSHVEIDTSQIEREEIANYLVLNAGIPIDLVPEDLRAGGASY